jgi:hypothetical protein
MTGHPTCLTPWQKLEALSMRYYGCVVWEPNAGDFYTTSRADLELYQVVDVTDTEVITRYCTPNTRAEDAQCPRDEFLSRIRSV